MINLLSVNFPGHILIFINVLVILMIMFSLILIIKGNKDSKTFLKYYILISLISFTLFLTLDKSSPNIDNIFEGDFLQKRLIVHRYYLLFSLPLWSLNLFVLIKLIKKILSENKSIFKVIFVSISIISFFMISLTTEILSPMKYWIETWIN